MAVKPLAAVACLGGLVAFLPTLVFTIVGIIACRKRADVTIALLALLIQGLFFVFLIFPPSSIHACKGALADVLAVIIALQLLAAHYHFELTEEEEEAALRHSKASCPMDGVIAGCFSLLLALFDLGVLVMLSGAGSIVSGAFKSAASLIDSCEVGEKEMDVAAATPTETEGKELT
ncbi:hypothetical protein BSKO_09023 [Bryopsis sp. KO-2023]|nr:hypothetical protein BSKO_09023 [Bryopsis sp. KO-2023]